MNNNMLIKTFLAIIVCFQPATTYLLQDYKAVVAVYDKADRTNRNCSNGANYNTNIDDLTLGKLNITSRTLLRFCSPTILLEKNLTLSNLEYITFVG